MSQSTVAVPTGPVPEGAKHKKQPSRLEDQAALAALYVSKNNQTDDYKYLDSDHKLSSAGAAASLKYAEPHNLPSFPSAGLKKDDSAAGAAASLGWSNQKSFEHWKPDPSASASKAAQLANDYKMAPLWQPESTSNGAKAAVMAHKDGSKVEIWRPEANSWGNSAAAQAFKKYGAGNTLSPQVDSGPADLSRQRSLKAATSAMSSSRQRAVSNPSPAPKLETYPDEAQAVKNALSAATSSMKKKRTTDHIEGGSVPYTTMSKEMYTANPPVAPEVAERNHNDVLRASAVAMAKRMYNYQQSHLDVAAGAHHGAAAAHARNESTTTTGSYDDEQPMKFINLQEAAQKLAQERLSKLHDEHTKNREYRDYYSGKNDAASPSGRSSGATTSRLSMRGRPRRRASSTGTADSDTEQSNRIRAQMSMFSSTLSQVDAQKRDKDREALIAAAQRNVTAKLHGMDERVFAETGKIGPSLLSEWEVKAHAAAQAKSESRMENYGKVSIGGGKFVDQSAIDAIAAKNVQPVLDDINEKAEKERLRQEGIKADQDLRKKEETEKKAREKEEKEINKKLKQQDKEERKAKEAEEKASRDEEKRLAAEQRKFQKAAAKEEKEKEKAIIAEQKEEEKAEKQGKKAEAQQEKEEAKAATQPEKEQEKVIEDEESEKKTERETPITAPPTSEPATLAALTGETPAVATSPSKGEATSPSSDSKVKSWLKNRFSKRRSKTPLPSEESFVGGAALTGARTSSTHNSSTSLPRAEASASASKASPVAEAEPEEGKADVSKSDDEVSALSANSREEFQEARDTIDEDLMPPPSFTVEKKAASPARETKFVEQI